MTRTFNFKINGKNFTACLDSRGMTLKNLKKNQAVDLINYDEFWAFVFETEDGLMEVEFEHDVDKDKYTARHAVLWDADGIIIDTFKVTMKIK